MVWCPKSNTPENILVCKETYIHKQYNYISIVVKKSCESEGFATLFTLKIDKSNKWCYNNNNHINRRIFYDYCTQSKIV